MKSKLLAVVVVAMLALSIVPVFSYEPEEDVVLFIDPQEIKFDGPCCESQTFEAEVMIWNVDDLYAWDIIIEWNPTYLNLTDWEIKVPADWPADGYQVLIDDWHDGWYQFAVTRLGNITGFTGTMALANLFFHVEYEPCWPGCITTWIYIDEYALSGKCGYTIEPDLVEDGEVGINPSKPNVEITFSDESPLEPKLAQGWYEKQVITAYVWVSNVTKFWGFAFNITWDPDLLEIDLQQITINEEAFPQPWTFLEQSLCPCYGDYYLEIWRPDPEDKPPLKGTFWIVKMDFKVKCFTDEYGIPDDDATSIRFDKENTWLYMCDHYYEYYEDNLDVSDAIYFWTPIPFDFDQNGHVGVEDILIILDHYNDDYPAGEGFDFANDDGWVDIYDIVIVAKYYCNDTPPEMPEP